MRATGNRLFDSMPSRDSRFLRAAAEPLTLAAGQQLFAPGEALATTYFPTTLVLAQLVRLESGASLELATVGAEGCLDVAPVLGRRSSTLVAVVRLAGECYAVETARLLELHRRSESVRRILLAYADYSCRASIQTAICNAYHSIDQRLARWLLLAHERRKSSEFALTQGMLAQMVSATRPRVSEAAARLRAAEAIGYRGGRVRIISRPRLAGFSCTCYEAIRPGIASR